MITNWVDVAEVIGLVGGTAVGLRVLWKLVVLLHHKWMAAFGIEELMEDVSGLDEQLKYVVSELQPNGGASVRDSLNRIELRQVLQEQRQRAILSDMSIGVFETDPSGKVTWVNRKLLRMSGRSPAEVYGFGWLNTVALRDRERIDADWHTAVKEGREYESEFLMITPDDDRVNVSIRTYKMVDMDTKQNLGYVGMLTPIEGSTDI